MARCKLCGKNFRSITNTHLRAAHKTAIRAYNKRFGTNETGFSVRVNTLPKNDPRYIRWKKSLLKRPPPWCSGYTKKTHSSVAKISATFKKKKIDNFAEWREKARKEGRIPESYPPLKRTENLAFLIGMTLGDGNIHRHPRTEQLRITLGTDKPELWQYTKRIVEETFNKRPRVYEVKDKACIVINLYQKDISKRLGIPCGNRKDALIEFPKWIRNEKKFLIPFLRGLYEAEGSFCVHEPTYTHKIVFTNKNNSLLEMVHTSLTELGFHPHANKYKVQLSKKKEVYELKNLIKFRKY